MAGPRHDGDEDGDTVGATRLAARFPTGPAATTSHSRLKTPRPTRLWPALTGRARPSSPRTSTGGSCSASSEAAGPSGGKPLSATPSRWSFGSRHTCRWTVGFGPPGCGQAPRGPCLDHQVAEDIGALASSPLRARSRSDRRCRRARRNADRGSRRGRPRLPKRTRAAFRSRLSSRVCRHPLCAGRPRKGASAGQEIASLQRRTATECCQHAAGHRLQVTLGTGEATAERPAGGFHPAGHGAQLLIEPVQRDHVQIVARCLPAVEAAEVGGDWHDTFIQPDGANLLAIGDVIGHDTQAAAAMGQVRTLLRGLGAAGNDGPAVLCSAESTRSFRRCAPGSSRPHWSADSNRRRNPITSTAGCGCAGRTPDTPHR
jgi:hypothetical protein